MLLTRVTAVVLFVVTRSTVVALDRWERFGEVTDAATLSQPALSDEFINTVNEDPKSTWTAGRNTIFEAATLGEAKVLMGTLQQKDPSGFLPYKAQEHFVELPADFDWRTDSRAANCPSVKEIRDQANCGSCWAFGSVEAMTDRICIASNGTKKTHLSAQDVTSCDHLGDMGCNGGIPSSVYSYWKSFGIVAGGNYGDKSMCYSYQLKPCAHHSVSPKYPACNGSAATPKCARQCIDNKASWVGSKTHGAGGYSVCSQDASTSCSDAMMQEIYQKGPITGMFFVHKSFLAYKSGVYQGKGLLDPLLGGHAIKILGWGVDGGVPYWLVANSWNEDWGDKGFFKIKRGSNLDQIENPMINGGPVAGMPKADTMPPTIPIIPSSSNSTHYEKPPCRSDETKASVQNTTGEVCAPECTAGGTCPTDVPPGTKAKPQCILQDAGTGKKYCGLFCIFSSGCPQGATCARVGGLFGICVYPTSKVAASPKVLQHIGFTGEELHI